MPATYDGSPIFGLAVRMKTTVNPAADQVNSFFGIGGMESLFGGTRGRVTLVEGVLWGADVPSLAALEENFISYNDGLARVLVDTRGVTYDQVKFGAFEPVSERILQDSATGRYFRQYRASFTHLV